MFPDAVKSRGQHFFTSFPLYFGLDEALHLPFFCPAQSPFGDPCVLNVSQFPGSLWWSKAERPFSVRFTLYGRPQSVLLGFRGLVKLVLFCSWNLFVTLGLKDVFRLSSLSAEVPDISVVLTKMRQSLYLL